MAGNGPDSKTVERYLEALCRHGKAQKLVIPVTLTTSTVVTKDMLAYVKPHVQVNDALIEQVLFVFPLLSLPLCPPCLPACFSLFYHLHTSPISAVSLLVLLWLLDPLCVPIFLFCGMCLPFFVPLLPFLLTPCTCFCTMHVIAWNIDCKSGIAAALSSARCLSCQCLASSTIAWRGVDNILDTVWQQDSSIRPRKHPKPCIMQNSTPQLC